MASTYAVTIVNDPKGIWAGRTYELEITLTRQDGTSSPITTETFELRVASATGTVYFTVPNGSITSSGLVVTVPLDNDNTVLLTSRGRYNWYLLMTNLDGEPELPAVGALDVDIIPST